MAEEATLREKDLPKNWAFVAAQNTCREVGDSGGGGFPSEHPPPSPPRAPLLSAAAAIRFPANRHSSRPRPPQTSPRNAAPSPPHTPSGYRLPRPRLSSLGIHRLDIAPTASAPGIYSTLKHPGRSARSSAPPAFAARRRNLRQNHCRKGKVLCAAPLLPLPFASLLNPPPLSPFFFFFFPSPLSLLSPLLFLANGNLRLDCHCPSQNQPPSLRRSAGSRAGPVGAP